MTRSLLIWSLISLMVANLSAGVHRDAEGSEREVVPGDKVNPELLSRPWSANWIAVPKSPPFDYGVYHFRRTFELSEKPDSFIIHVSGDNRYQLFVNGVRAVWGPARGDLYHWRYETVDVGGLLKSGKNVLAAVVWNMGDLAPLAQVTNRTGFLLQGDTEAERIVDTNSRWRSVKDEAYSPMPVTSRDVGGYYAAGAGERVDGGRYPWGWERPDYDDTGWEPAEEVGRGCPRDAVDGSNRWMLTPRRIPPMEATAEQVARLRRSSGADVSTDFPGPGSTVRVPASTKATLLLDQGYLTTAYPELSLSAGRGASVSLKYAESLIEPGTGEKGNRNEIEGKVLRGYADEFIADGGRSRLFRPLWWRTYRYIEISIATRDEPLTLDGIQGIYTGYPFRRTAVFNGPEELRKILDTGWRTARLCAGETYMDCPYYEQLQYAGDTRVQALVSLYMSGDGRLMRNAIELLDDSRTSEGATYSRAPSRLQQYIPPFSLWWIGMLHDYWMYQDDPGFVGGRLPGVHAVLSFFQRWQKPDGSLGPVPWWNFVDWTRQWNYGIPGSGTDGSSAPLNVQLLLAYQWAADLEKALGSKSAAQDYRRDADRLGGTIRRMFWDRDKGLFADTEDKAHFSQHTNALAILAGLARADDAKRVIDRVLADQSLVQCSIYFRFYLCQAVVKAGEGDRYISLLDPWRRMLGRGLSTWSEQEDPTRSDCHGWGASPNIEMFRTVLGIDSAAPGFARVLIAPHLGDLKEAGGSIPHPKGTIEVHYQVAGGKPTATIILPAGVTGEFVWKDKTRRMKSGRNEFVI